MALFTTTVQHMSIVKIHKYNCNTKPLATFHYIIPETYHQNGQELKFVLDVLKLQTDYDTNV